MKKINVFSLVAFVPWLCFAYLLFICNSCSDMNGCGFEPSIFEYNQIAFQVIDANSKEKLFQGIRPGGIYPSSKVKVVLEHGELARKYKMEIDDIASFMYADSSDIDAIDKTKTKFFYLHLVDKVGNLDIDTIKVDFKFINEKKCRNTFAEKVTVSYNGKVAFDKYNDGTVLQLQKNL